MMLYRQNPNRDVAVAMLKSQSCVQGHALPLRSNLIGAMGKM